jgi:uncharacterized membrane protein YfcA
MQIALIIIGLRFILKPVNRTPENPVPSSHKSRVIKAIIGGTVVGFICGFIGAGGGMMLLLVLTAFLGYPMHMAVGTSVFIMAFTALTGGISHFVIAGRTDLFCLFMCVAFTLIWARIAAKIANRSDERVLKFVVGVVMILTGASVLAVNNLLR